MAGESKAGRTTVPAERAGAGLFKPKGGASSKGEGGYEEDKVCREDFETLKLLGKGRGRRGRVFSPSAIRINLRFDYRSKRILSDGMEIGDVILRGREQNSVDTKVSVVSMKFTFSGIRGGDFPYYHPGIRMKQQSLRRCGLRGCLPHRPGARSFWINLPL